LPANVEVATFQEHIPMLEDWAMLERLVTVATFDDGIRAALARNHLEAEGIDAVLNDELTVSTDWALSTAVGGIKLQVRPLQLERAEYLLAQLVAQRSDDEEVQFTTSAESAWELAEEREAELAERNPSNQIADRAFRAAVGGFLFFPLHFYVWWLLASLLESSEPVSRDRRWKVWAAAVFNLPLMVLITVGLAVVASIFR
jgi:hypothetical protein